MISHLHDWLAANCCSANRAIFQQTLTALLDDISTGWCQSLGICQRRLSRPVPDSHLALQKVFEPFVVPAPTLQVQRHVLIATDSAAVTAVSMHHFSNVNF